MFKRRDEEIGFAYSDKIHWLQLGCLDHRLCQGRQSNGFPPNFVHSLDVAWVEMIPPWGWDAGSLWYLQVAEHHQWELVDHQSKLYEIYELAMTSSVQTGTLPEGMLKVKVLIGIFG